MPDLAGDRTFDPTPHRRREARKRGHVARSHDLVSAVLLVAGLVVLALVGEGLVRFLGGYAAQQLGGPAWLATDVASVESHFAETLRGLSRHVLPIFGLLVVGAIAANLGQIGWMFLPERVAPDASRLDPLRGLQRLFSFDSASRLGLGLVKILVIGAVAWFDLYAKRDAILAMGGLGVGQIVSFAASVLLWTSLKIGVALLVLAVLDYGVRRWKYERDLKMSPQELREEMRDAEGDPEVRARRRRAAEQWAQGRLLGAVPRADVVLTSGAGLAVAIRYESGPADVPTLVAKGTGSLAVRIRQLAARHGVAVLEERRLAQALHRDVDVEHAIPRDHYAAVARILAQVHQNQARQPADAA
jgi:flagellar biosynthesis protein FlhB